VQVVPALPVGDETVGRITAAATMAVFSGSRGDDRMVWRVGSEVEVVVGGRQRRRGVLGRRKGDEVGNDQVPAVPTSSVGQGV
jgi:hypothetical protein